ncbi:hypothetical protein [Lutibacter sp.]
MKNLLLGLLVIGFVISSQAQQNDFKASKSQFMIRGYGHTGINFMNNEGEKESSFQGATFAPIFLFKHSDKLLFEAELEFGLEGNNLDVGLEYADLMYVINKNVTVRAGKFLLPFGTFMERLHPSWVNRFPTKPLGFGHDGIAPSSGVGIELRGAFESGQSKINYAIYATNGPRLKDGSIEPEEAGMLLFQNFEDNNLSKALGGRLGFLPFNDSSTEIGISAYSTNATGAQDTPYENTGAFLYALDFSFVKQIPTFSGIVDIKAQYNNSKVDQASFTKLNEDTGLNEDYNFDNKSNSFYTQLSYRPTMADSDFLKKIEILGRLSMFNTPEGAEWEENSKQYALGINYWLSWRSLIKVSYQTTDKEGGHDTDSKTKINGFFIHWAVGF